MICSRSKDDAIIYVRESLAAQTKVVLSESNSYRNYQVLHLVDMNLIIEVIYRSLECPADMFIEPIKRIA